MARDLVSVRVEGLDELRAAARAAGAQVPEVMKEAHGEIVRRLVPSVSAAAPRRSGRLSGAFGEGRHTASFGVMRAQLVYAGPIIFGWPTRGLNSRSVSDETFGRAAAVLSTKTGRRVAAARRRGPRSRKGRVVGGPIRANPFPYRVLDRRRSDIEEIYEKRLAKLAAVLEG